jgi:hypothetical protein
MMARVRLLVLALAAVLLAGCVPLSPITSITGSGHPTTVEFDLAGFSKVDAGSAFRVEITQGDGYSVSVTVDDNLVDRLDVTKSGDTLRIYLKPSTSIHNVNMSAKVTMPDLTGLDLSGATRTTIAGFSSGKSLDAEVSGASRLQGDIKSGNARFDLSGASQMDLQGSAGNLDLTVSGASTATLDGFESKNTSVEASGASHATVNASGALNVEASGASSVTYVGQPANLKVNTSGASTVRQK